MQGRQRQTCIVFLAEMEAQEVEAPGRVLRAVRAATTAGFGDYRAGMH